MFKSSICEEPDRVVMYFEGRLDTPEAAKTERQMKALYDYQNQSIVLDLTNLIYISSSGLRLFLALLQDARSKGNTVAVVGLSPYIRRVFDETGFSRLFKLS